MNKIERKNKIWVLGFHLEETADKWIQYIKKAIEYAIQVEKRIRTSIQSNTGNFSVLRSCIQKEETSEEVILHDGKDPSAHRNDNRETEIDLRGSGFLGNESFRKSTVDSMSTSEEKVTLASFEILKEIGSGSFGKVYKVVLNC